MTLEDNIHTFRLRVMVRAQVLHNASRACREFGIPRTVYYRWRKRYLAYGRDGLHPPRQLGPRRGLQPISAFLEGSRTAKSLSLVGPKASRRSIRRLGLVVENVNLLSWHVLYLGREARSANPKRSQRATREPRLEPATVRLYGQAALTWFAFLADELLLPERFPAAAAVAWAPRQL